MTTPNDLPPVGATAEEIEALAERLQHDYLRATRPSLSPPRRSVSIAIDDCGGAATILTDLMQERDQLKAAVMSVESAMHTYRRQAESLGVSVAGLEKELSHIDSVIARRPALDLPTRRENIEKAIRVAGESDALRAEVARLRGSFSRYGQHLFGCEVEQTDYCTCGLARAAQEGK